MEWMLWIKMFIYVYENIGRKCKFFSTLREQIRIQAKLPLIANWFWISDIRILWLGLFIQLMEFLLAV